MKGGRMSADKRQFSLALESHLELKTDKPSLQPVPIPVPPNLDTVLAEIGPLPHEALFLGVATDGLPVLLNLSDHTPGPLLIVSDAGAGKTGFLRSIANAVTKTHRPTDLQFGIVTDCPDEWEEMDDAKHLTGIFSVNRVETKEFILALASWAHKNKDSKQTVLLLIDNLEAVAKLDFDVLQNIRWLLARGPSRHVWPIITMNADRYGQVLSWVSIFRSRIFGRIRNERVAEVLSGDKMSTLAQLEVPIQFSLRENEKWVKFWVPGF